MIAKTYLIIAAISGLAAVAIGAFGAHGLKGRIDEDLIAVYQTGVQYHFYHTFALLAVSILLIQFPHAVALKWGGMLFILGTLLFSGSLYLLSITGIRWLGAITPLGGVAFIAGWVFMAIAALTMMETSR